MHGVLPTAERQLQFAKFLLGSVYSTCALLYKMPLSRTFIAQFESNRSCKHMSESEWHCKAADGIAAMLGKAEHNSSNIMQSISHRVGTSLLQVWRTLQDFSNQIFLHFSKHFHLCFGPHLSHSP
jgi:hypothetical protein